MEDTIEICSTIVSPNTDPNERISIWDRLRPWLATKGYYLYQYDGNNWYPQYYVETKPDLFFPEMGGDPDMSNSHLRPLQTRFVNRVGFAQDVSFRHYALKLMEIGSVEHKILTLLHKNKEDAISNCVLPVLDFLEIGNFTFAIMPRWGTDPKVPWFLTVRHAATFIQHILKAFSFLHKHYIVYQDIKLGNILVDHFGAVDSSCMKINEMRRVLKCNNRIKYALCDFDSSYLLSPSSSGKPIRLPSAFSWDILFQKKPHDTIQGEPDYDPFAFDIGVLGIFFWGLFSSNVKNFPLIVPLVDKMITGKLEERFSAEEALKFVEDNILGGSDELLNQELDPLDKARSASWEPDRHDKWANLPTDFVEKWGAYKAPKSSYRDLILRNISTRVYKGYQIVKFFRSLRHKS